MYFCNNPKCKFHVIASYDKYFLSIIVCKPPSKIAKMFEIPSEHVSITTETRMKHKWIDPKKVSEWFFCDVCNEAALMVVSEQN